MNDEIILEGKFSYRVYFSEQNGYSVCHYKSKRGGIFNAVGYNLPTRKGVTYVFHGRLENSGYGEQINVTSYEEHISTDKDSIVGYLSSGVIAGIGKTLAERIYDEFGDKTFDVIDNAPEQLTKVKGISKTKLTKILKSYKDNRALREITTFLIKYDISEHYAADLYGKYGADTVDKIRENPYILSYLSGVTFETADSIAAKLNVNRDSSERFRACVNSVLKSEEQNGNTGMDIRELQSATMRLIRNNYNGPIETMKTEWSRMLQDRELIVKKIAFDKKEPKQYVFTKHIANLEENTSDMILAMRQTYELPDNYEKTYRMIQGRENVILDGIQRSAVKSALSHGIMILTGGPGTGKTTTERMISEMYKALYPDRERVYIAPTGRAARRMSESIQEPAYTAHSYLNLLPSGDLMQTGEEVIIENALIIIDEMSMVDIFLMNTILKAIRSGCCLVLVGDENQLPSVRAGRVLQDMLESKAFPVVQLEHVYRQNEDEFISINAKKINNGIDDLTDGNDYHHHELSVATDIAEKMKEIYLERTKEFGFGNVLCLCPFKERTAGVHDMNERIQAALMPYQEGQKEIITNGYKLHEGDLVMQIKKNTAEVSNGDIGIVQKIYQIDEQNYVDCLFNGKTVTYKGRQELELLVLAYAATIHKSQGSEAPAVVFCLADWHVNMKYRAIPYVAISRGKKQVDVVGTKSALAEAIHNKKNTERISLFGCYIKIKAGMFVAA